MLLYSLKNPYRLTNEQQVRHLLLTSYAKDLSGKDIPVDTMIFFAKDYLETANNPKYLALAEYYLGRIYQANGENEQALQLYLNAKATAESSDDDDIKGLTRTYIGQQYYIQGNHNDAINNFKSALEYFGKSKENYKRVITVLNKLGNSFLIANEKDSAMACYNKAFQYAKIAQDSADIMHNRGVTYLMLNELDNAKQQLFQSLKLNSDSTLQSLIYLNLSKIYEKEKLLDSVVYFVGLSSKFSKNHILLNNYMILSKIEREKYNYKDALNYYQQYTDCLIRINNETPKYNIQEIEQKYQLETRLNKKDELIIKLIVSGIMTLFVNWIIFSIFLYRKNNRSVIIKQKITELQTELQTKLSDIDTKEKSLYRFIHRNIKKIVLFDHYMELVNDEIDKEAIVTIMTSLNLKKDNTDIYADINILYDKIFDDIKDKYPKLTEQELKIICLTYVEFDNLAIAETMNLNVHVIERNKSYIRKKLKIKHRRNIKTFILEKIKGKM
jgi:tetratricopeptide (TPR) repeat protein